MCSSSSGTNETDVKITEQLSEMDITEHNVSSPGADVYLEAILPNEIFAKITDFLANDHDSLEALYFTSKRMANRIKPFLVEKRKKLLSVFVDFLNANDNSANFLDKCDLLLLKSEKYLKRVLRTNEYLSLRAHNLPMRRLSFVLLGVGDSISEENKLSLEERAHKLLKIAQLHCYEFSAFYDSMTLLDIAFGEENNLSKDSLKKMEQALAYRIFKRFMHKYPILCKFTDVIWPQGMSDEIKKQMAKEFGEENYRTAPKNRATKPRKMGRMFEMRTFGRVRNPSTRPSRERKYKYYSRNRYYYNEYHYNDDYYFDSSGYEYY